jgi:hypothetical protein
MQSRILSHAGKLRYWVELATSDQSTPHSVEQ